MPGGHGTHATPPALKLPGAQSTHREPSVEALPAGHSTHRLAPMGAAGTYARL